MNKNPQHAEDVVISYSFLRELRCLVSLLPSGIGLSVLRRLEVLVRLFKQKEGGAAGTGGRLLVTWFRYRGRRGMLQSKTWHWNVTIC